MVTTVARSDTPSASRFWRTAAIAGRACSTNVHCAAPRLSASMPSAPEPANRSSTVASRTTSRLASVLNVASRTRSLVGRVAARRARPAAGPAGAGHHAHAATLRAADWSEMEPEATITCVDCGGRAHLLTYPREDGTWLPGDVVAYRCEDCLDRWDLVLPDDWGEDDDRPGREG